MRHRGGCGKFLVALAGSVALFFLLSHQLLFSPSSRVYHQFGLWPSGSNGGKSSCDRYVSLGGALPETRYVTGVAGFSYFQNLYLFNNTFFFVSSDPSDLPAAGGSYIVTGDYTLPNITRGKHLAPGPDRWQVLSPDEARLVMGGHVAIREPGTTMWFNDDDAPQIGIRSFLDHYYHCEMFLGAWRLTVAAGNHELPARIIYRAAPTSWRDSAKITPWFQEVLAGTAIEESFRVLDRAQSGMTYLFEEIALCDRWAAHRHGNETRWWNKVTGDLPSLQVRLDWFAPLRHRVVAMAETSGCRVNRADQRVPVVTYVDRQLTNRRLEASDHAALLDAMRDLEAEGVIEFNHARMENLLRHEQFCMAARTDVMLGVHGNGLSHQLWMLPGAGVIEMMEQNGFTRDYAILAELMSHEYYATHNDTYLPVDKWRKPDGWAVDQGRLFHSANIRVHAPYVASLVRDMAWRRRGGPTPMQWPRV